MLAERNILKDVAMERDLRRVNILALALDERNHCSNVSMAMECRFPTHVDS